MSKKSIFWAIKNKNNFCLIESYIENLIEELEQSYPDEVVVDLRIRQIKQILKELK